jgi:hypothetical protein
MWKRSYRITQPDHWMTSSFKLRLLNPNEKVHGINIQCMYVYVFVGAGFPMHCDLIWSIVRPL